MNIYIEEYLGNGYYVVQKIQGDGTVSEYTLAKMKLNQFDDVITYDEFISSKHKDRVLKKFGIFLNQDKTIINNFKETIKDLSEEELLRLLPSYYKREIMERIDEIAKSKRNTKKTTKTRSRKRNLS